VPYNFGVPSDQSWWIRRRWLLLRRTLAITGGLALLALFGWFWWQGVPELYSSAGGGQDVENARLNAVTTTRAALLAGLVGLGALGTFWLNSRVYRITARTFELTEQGQLTDRYTKAIAQLGDDKLDIRLGGIYALERIAVDSKRDHPTIVEVLSAYVRERTAPKQLVRAPNRRTAHPRALRKQAKLGVDVQAALTVLCRLPVRAGVSRGNLNGANLTGANLYQANLTKTSLFKANLTEADLSLADLTEASLSEADLTKARLVEANLTEANLSLADLTRANLVRANLTKAHFISANLTKANLYQADLSEATLLMANLTDATLGKANLTKASLGGANLTKAILLRANLTDARGLAQEQLDGAFGDSQTMVPTGLRRPEAWSR